MGEWRRLRIGDVCDIVKGETGLASATPGQYPMVATGAERRSCNTYQFDTEAVCIPLVSSTGHGKKTLNYVHYQSGKFALGTILAAVIPKDPKVLTARYLHLYLSHFKDTVLVPLMKGAANVSLPMKGIASVEIPVPPVDQQQKLIDLIGRIESEHRELLEEGNRQADIFKQLRQAVLQEAVEGKLTADWRKQHPLVQGDPQHDAVALLARIKAEKDRLVKSGKIRKEKPLQQIADSDKPFELPAGWVWCRLGEVVDSLFDGPFGSHLKTSDYTADGARVIRLENIGFMQFKNEKETFISKAKYKLLEKHTVCEGDIIFASFIADGIRCCLLPSLQVDTIAKADCFCIRINHASVVKQLLVIVFASEFMRKELFDVMHGMTRLRINTLQLRKSIFPLPPLAEQQAIVARVDSLMASIDALEAQVTERKEQAQQLMQAVLREAFL